MPAPIVRVEIVEGIDEQAARHYRVLRPTEATVWLARPEEPAGLEQHTRLLALLSDDERERMARFRLDADRRLFLLGHGLVRLALSRHSDVDPRNWRFCLGPHGRPEIAAPPSRLRFTLSHTRGLTGCAVIQDQDIGLDVEDTSCGASIDVAKHFLSTPEMRDYLAAPAAVQPRRFFEYWTLKEAYMKARGFGFSLPFDRFSFYRDRRGVWRIAFAPSFDDDPGGWWFRSWQIGSLHQAALAVSVAFSTRRVAPYADAGGAGPGLKGRRPGP
jgi:4'-phosphopantetheinyl transferase